MEFEIYVLQSNKRKRVCYSPLTQKSDGTFLDLLIGGLKDDKRREDEQFESDALKWYMEKIEEALRERFPHLKPKLKAYIECVSERLRTIYEIVYDMQNQSGFSWDDENKMIRVDSDEVWKEYVERNPHAMLYRNTPIPLFDKLARVYGKHHAGGKELANPGANIEMIDTQEEEQSENEENEIETTLLSPRKHGCIEDPSKKRNGGENAIINRLFEFEKNIKGLLENHIEQMRAVVNRLGVDRDIYEDSRKVMNELTKMGLTEQQYFTAADRIFSMPHRLHIFWGCNDVNRLAYVKSLI